MILRRGFLGNPEIPNFPSVFFTRAITDNLYMRIDPFGLHPPKRPSAFQLWIVRAVTLKKTATSSGRSNGLLGNRVKRLSSISRSSAYDSAPRRTAHRAGANRPHQMHLQHVRGCRIQNFTIKIMIRTMLYPCLFTV